MLHNVGIDQVLHVSLGAGMSSVVSERSSGWNHPLTGQASRSLTRPSFRRAGRRPPPARRSCELAFAGDFLGKGEGNGCRQVPQTPVCGYERGPAATSFRQGLRSQKYSPAIETAKYAKYAKEVPGVGFAFFAWFAVPRASPAANY
jgi:hypothetical protein